MPTFNEGIRTVEGENLFNRVKNGYTDIHYTRIVFSSLDLSGKSDNDISQLTDVQPQELSVKTQTVSDTQDDGETDIRAIATNEPLTAGVNINTYALYAMDDQKREVLFGVAVDNHPSYLPAHAPGEQIQYLTYDWTSSIKDTNKIEMTDPNDVIVTYDEFNRYRNSLASSANSYHNSLSASASGANSALSMSAEGGIDGNGQRTEVVSSQATSYTNSAAASLTSVINTNSGNASGSAQSVMNQANANMETNRANLQNSINGLPSWFDMNWTRNTMIPSGAASAANAANNYTNGKIGSLAGVVGANSANASSSAQSVMNQANTNMENNRVSLSNSVNGLPHWWDENWTRNNVAPSLANSARDAANDYTTQQATSLNGRVQANEKNILFHGQISNTAFDFDTTRRVGFYQLSNVTVKHAPKECEQINNGEMWGWLQDNYIDSGTSQQTFYCVTTGATYARYRGAGSTSKWSKVATLDDINGLQSQINSNVGNINGTRNDLQGQITRNNNYHDSVENHLQDQVNSNTNWITSGLPTKNQPKAPTTDLNNLMAPGYYQYDGVDNVKHLPSGYGVNPQWFVIQVLETTAGNFQIFYSFINNDIFMRSSNDGSNWNTDWVEVTGQYRMDDLQNQINNNYGQANTAATNAMNQANAYTDGKVNDLQGQLQGQINSNNHIFLKSNQTLDLNTDVQRTGFYFLSGTKLVNAPAEAESINGGVSWGWLQVMFNDSGTFQQTLSDITANNIYTRFTGAGNIGPWQRVTNQVQTADNESDAQNKSNQNPGTLYVYSD